MRKAENDTERARAAVRATLRLRAEALHSTGDWTTRVFPYFASDAHIAELVDEARTDRRVWEFCRTLVKILSDRRRPLPPELAAWAVEAMDPATRPPKAPPRGTTRDDVIREAVSVAALFISAYAGDDRRSDPETVTAVDIVSVELSHHGVELSPGRVKGIYKAKK
jgi:hypothetical protein